MRMRKLLMFVLLLAILGSLFGPVGYSRGQDSCGDAPAPRLVVGSGGHVSYTDGRLLNVRDSAGVNGVQVGQLLE
jgi:hypothetical protein